MKKFALLASLMLLIMMSACSPQKKLERMIEKHPNLFEKETITVTVRDTVNYEKTVYLPPVEKEQTFEHTRGKNETFVLENDDFKTVVSIDNTSKNFGHILDNVKVKTTVKEKTITITDTLYINKKVKVNVIKTKPIITKKTPRWAYWSFGLNILIILLILAFIFNWFKYLPKINFGAVLILAVLGMSLQSCSGISKSAQQHYSAEFAKCENDKQKIDSLNKKIIVLEKMVDDSEANFCNLLRNHKLFIEKLDNDEKILCQDFAFYFKQFDAK